ncbi:unnamed protein product [Effrenium voratum]|nr:unnamed protein product [Effrenium voratum]CAJ1424459.1 unnamed protein product [Effrenium voratum]
MGGAYFGGGAGTTAFGRGQVVNGSKDRRMAEELYNTGEAITSVTSHRLSTKPSNFRDRFASGGGDRMERDRGDPGSKEVLQRLERIEQTLTRLSSLAGNCACQNGGAALGMKPSAFAGGRPLQSPSIRGQMPE